MPRVYLADKDTLDNVNDKVGTSSDTASSAPTTLFAGIKSLISTLATHVANWTAARAAKIDNLDNLGATGDTGGSTSAGTVMAKLNALLTSWTSTRAGYLDNIRSYTITNNTASKTGVLSAKLAYIISLLENTTYGLSAIKSNLGSICYTPGTAQIATLGYYASALTATTDSSDGNFYKISDNWVAPASGYVRVQLTVTVKCALKDAGDESNYGVYVDVFALSGGSANIGYSGYGYGVDSDFINYLTKSKGSLLKTGRYNSISDVAKPHLDGKMGGRVTITNSNTSKSQTITVDIAVEKGWPMFVGVMLHCWSSTCTATVTSLKICGTSNSY